MSRIAPLLRAFPVVLAPMEAITNAAFRRIARSVGASLCMTEFVGAEPVLPRRRRQARGQVDGRGIMRRQ